MDFEMNNKYEYAACKEGKCEACRHINLLGRTYCCENDERHQESLR